MEMVAQLFAASYLMSIGSVDGRYGAANELTAPPESRSPRLSATVLTGPAAKHEFGEPLDGPWPR